MTSIIERIRKNKFWHFHGGIHPPEQKQLTTNNPIKHIPLPKQLILPLQQHIGHQGDLLVEVGDKVLKGQALTQSSSPMAVPIHAPTSGVVSAIKKSVIAHPSGLSELCLFIDVDGKDAWRQRKTCQDYTQLSHQEIIKSIADAGIAGMGGAGFPTHIKVSTKSEIDFLIINAAECEPYITADDLLMQEQSEAIVDGIKILDQVLKPTFILIGIENNKPQAITALQKATKNIDKINICVLPTKYPTGGEKQLIKILTGKEINSGSLPIQSGIVVQNVATCFAISDAIIHDIPLIKRVVTLTGQALTNPQNLWALLGTPVSYLLAQTGFIDETIDNPTIATLPAANPPVIMGGPMMGYSISNELVPIVKTSNCILAPSKVEMPSAFDNNSNEMECIRCGQCSDVCPSQLLPQELQWSAKAKDHQQLTKLNLFDCIDCGACAYVCPSQIPLVQYYRIAKAEIRQQQQLDIKADKAKTRFEARKLRLEKEKTVREEKHKKAAAARKAAMSKKNAAGETANSAVAAALARVKAKKEQNKATESQVSSHQEKNDKNSESQIPSGDEKSQVKAAIARAKAKRLAKNDAGNKEIDESHVASSEEIDDEPANTSEKKSQVKAAIARAKAKRLAKNDAGNKEIDESHVSSSEEIDDEPANTSEKKSQVKAAIARAKAKRLAKNDVGNKEIDESHVANDEQNNMAKNEPSAIYNEQAQKENTLDNAAIDKKIRIAAAVAKAKAKVKAKKQQNKLAVTDNEEQVQPNDSRPDNPKPNSEIK